MEGTQIKAYTIELGVGPMGENKGKTVPCNFREADEMNLWRASPEGVRKKRGWKQKHKIETNWEENP